MSFLRKVHAAAAKGQIAEVRGGLPLEVAYFLLNRKKRELAQIENDYEIVVTIKGKPSFLLNQLELETIRREKQREESMELETRQQLQVVEVAEPEAVAAAEGTVPPEGDPGPPSPLPKNVVNASVRKRVVSVRLKRSLQSRPTLFLITQVLRTWCQQELKNLSRLKQLNNRSRLQKNAAVPVPKRNRW